MSEHAMPAPVLRPAHSLPPLWQLWFGIAAGPIAWATQLTLAYFFVTLQCAESAGSLDTLRIAVDIALGAVCLAGELIAWLSYRTAGAAPEGPRRDRCRFMAGAGMLLSAMFFAGLLLASIPEQFLETCNAR
jgi:hypothetical protein